MGRIYSPREKRLQRLLIPVNILSIILAIVCIFSLIFTPIVKVDVGKVLSDDRTISMLNDAVGNMVGDMFGSGESSEGEEDGTVSAVEVDYMPVISAVMTGVLKNAEGAVTISAYSASKVAFAPKEEKAKIALDELVLGKNAIITKLIDSIADAIPNIFKQEETIKLIEQAMVKTIISSLASELPEEAAEKLTVENVTKLTDALRDLENIPEGQTVEDAADNFVNTISEILGDDFNAETDGETIRNFIVDNYNETLEYTDEFSLEALISVAISKNVDLGSKNESQPATEPESEPEGSASLKRAVADEVEGEDENKGEEEGEEPDDPSENDPPAGEEPDDPSKDDPTGGEDPNDPPKEDPSEGEEPSTGENERVICTTYDELLKQLGFDTGAMSELSANVRAMIEDTVNEVLGEYTRYLEYYGYLFYIMLAFAVPWAIMIFFAFLRIFLKNKHFLMWYVMLFGFIPSLVWVVITALPFIINTSFVSGLLGDAASIINVALSGISSSMWICGLCYILLWALAIFWVFPVRLKIRKERRKVKAESIRR